MNMERKHGTETSLNLYQTTRCHIQELNTLGNFGVKSEGYGTTYKWAVLPKFGGLCCF